MREKKEEFTIMDKVNLMLVFCDRSFSQAIIDHYSTIEIDDVKTFLFYKACEFVEKISNSCFDLTAYNNC
ncbi:Ewing'S Tumor-Associated Antigen 1 [Manis pentadactyla]|nr:Ewing'S Tumor-Associated Antigen 1 [Manis pentadactyla]